MHENLLYFVASAVVGVIAISWLSSFFGGPDLSKFPVANPQKGAAWSLKNSEEQNDFLFNARSIIHQGIEKFKRPFVLISEKGRRFIVLPPSFAEIIKNEPNLSLDEGVKMDFFTNFPGFEAIGESSTNHVVHDSVRIKLTQNLASVTAALVDEAAEVLDKRWGQDQQWHRINLNEDILDLVSHLSARVFLGPELSHNQEWLDISIAYTLEAFFAQRTLRQWPPALRPIAVWFIPECQQLRRTVARGKSIINAYIKKRETLKERPNDSIEWMAQVAKGRAYDPGNLQLAMSLAAIHTTSDLTKQALIDISQRPNLVEDLRTEVAGVLKTDGWEKTSLYKMRLLDSALKETQRLKPPSMISMNRLVLKDTILPDGTKLPKGAQVITSSDRHWDNDVYANADTYDGARFMKRRQEPGRENSSQLATVSPDHIAFGLGQHACPGRFFASNEVKVFLALAVLRYDFRVVDPSKAAPISYGLEMMVNPEAAIEVRRRPTSEY